MRLIVIYIPIFGHFVCFILELCPNNTSERTEVIYGSKNVMNTILQFLSNANTISSCGDYKAPSSF